MVFGIPTNPGMLLIVGFIALLLFGNRLPQTMRSLGQGVTEFKKGMAGIGDDDDDDRPSRCDRVPRED